MSQITHPRYIKFLLVGILLLAAGCSGSNQSSFDPDRGKHAAAWLPAQHASAVSSGTSSVGTPLYATDACTECHGADLSGGISGVSCTSCHLGGPTAVHPAAWDPIYLNHGPSVSAGVTPVDNCSNQYCHGTALEGVAGSGPSCTTCHSMPFDPATVTCGACHRIPPDGTKFPNLAGKHAKHATSSKASCDICHNGASSYVGDHRSGAIDFSFLAAYSAKTGSASFSSTAATCSQVSCHGGKTTPSWYTGSIVVNTQCSACHAAGTTQYNSYNSGEHGKHMGLTGVVCGDCHDTNKLAAVHFNDLDTTAMTEAAQTILDSRQYDGSSCSFTCHIKNEVHDRGMTW